MADEPSLRDTGVDEIPSIQSGIKDTVFDKLPVTVTVNEGSTNNFVQITFTQLKPVATGCFGTVFEAYLSDSRHLAVKRVPQDKRFKHRELRILKKLDHENITSLLYYFYTAPSEGQDIHLNIVMEFMPQTITKILRFYIRSKSYLPLPYVKVYVFQMLRAINYIHKFGICHRDLKPQNLLIDPSRLLLRICDFGSAKELIRNEKNMSYICSRYYRAPELIFGSTNYTVMIDMWSVGCIIAEIFTNKVLFPGESTVDQIVEIIKVLGSPSSEELADMNPDYKAHSIPVINEQRFEEIFTNPEVDSFAIDMMKKLLLYSPDKRLTAIQTMSHSFFDDLRLPNFKVGNKTLNVSLLDFNDIELTNVDDDIRKKLMPRT